MQQMDTNIFLQSLRGNQPMIILAYLMIGRAMTIEELESSTGLHNDTVRAAVKGLASKGLLCKQVGERGRGTWLPAGDTFFGRLLNQNPKISDSGSSSSSSFPVPSYLPLEQEEQPESEKIGFCLLACDEYGIREPKRSKISRLKHVTAEMIKGHCLQVRAEGLPLGTAIHRIEFNWMLDEKYQPESVPKNYWASVLDARDQDGENDILATRG